MSNCIIGTSASESADPALLKQAHIGWIRQDFDIPFVDGVGGQLSDKYVRSKEQARRWVAQGFRMMGVSHGLGIGTYKPDATGQMAFHWQSELPDWYGEPGSDAFMANYQAVCRFLADDLRGIVDLWQIANELDIPLFVGPLSVTQAAKLLESGARGLKEGNPAALVGPNMGGIQRGYYLYGRLYRDASDVLDYVGIDGYLGTWEPGPPQLWSERIALLHELTGKPVLINEWGFASRGEVLREGELPSGAPLCQSRKWQFSWGDGHTPAGQAAFVREAFRAFAKQKAHLMGLFFYRWEDQSHCWQCGAPDCPIETAWGLVDLHGAPKPSFTAFREGVEMLVG